MLETSGVIMYPAAVAIDCVQLFSKIVKSFAMPMLAFVAPVPLLTTGLALGLLLFLPLYLLREAQERGETGRLGPIGGHVAVQSIAGLIFSDPYAYWFRPGNTGGRWRPEDGVLRIGGRPIDSIARLMQAADA